MRKFLLLIVALAATAGAARAQSPAPRQKFTAADVKFMTGMIGHHAQAIEMATMAPKNGASPTLLTLAGRIMNAQRDEIRLMQQWLRERNQEVPDPFHKDEHEDMAGMHHHHDMMPGMLSEEQMKELAASRGEDFDKLFLRYMIQHHQGAVAMVKELFSSRGAALDDTVFKLASDVNVDQMTEIARMQRMLVELLFGKDDQ